MKKTATKKKKKSSDPDLIKTKRRIDIVAKERPSHKEVLKFLKQVIVEKSKVKPRIKVDSIDMNEELIELKHREGFPLIEKRDLKLGIPSATTLFKRLCALLKRNKKLSEHIDRINKALRSGELNLEELFKKAAAEDQEYMASVSDRLKLQRGILFFLAENSLKPIFEAYASNLKGYVNQENWWRGYCPICGSKPVIAELIGTERKRFLVCSCCGYQWRFMRTKCPFCENQNTKAFKFFFTEKEGKAYRVETCQKCKKYIKTVDMEELDEEIVPCVEDIGTLYLDILAQKEGYTREVHLMGFSLEGLFE